MDSIIPIRPKRIIRKSEVLERVPYSNATLYRKIKDGTFPKQIKVGERAVGWLESDIDQHIDDLVAASQARGVSVSS